jgi:hypothetical protein
MSDRATVLRRILRRADAPRVIDQLAGLSGTELTTVLLEIMRLRADTVAPAALLQAYQDNRFVGPAPVPWAVLRDTETRALRVVPAAFDVLQLSPVVPLATNSAVAPVHQDIVISALRGVEVLADPTNALALEAACRRGVLLREHPRSAELVRLATSHRVVRAQRFGPGAFAHFQLLALVTAGRDTGQGAFEQDAAVEHLSICVDACLATGASHVRLALTDLTDGSFPGVETRLREAFAGDPSVTVDNWQDRPGGRGYYAGFCCKVYATYNGVTLEVGDGGCVDWTQQLLANRKERLFTSGLGLDRMAAAAEPPDPDA